MKIAFNRAVRRTPWGGGSQFLTVFADYLIGKGHDVVHTLEDDLDVIVMLDPRWEEGGFDFAEIRSYKQKNSKTKVLHRVNDTGKTRGGSELDRLIINANRHVADHTVYISEWVARYYNDAVANTTNDTYERLNRLAEWRTRPHSIITNGCDENFFYPGNATYDGSRKLRLVTHHWSDNPAKGLDLYRYIDENVDLLNVEFTYIGRYPKGYTPRNTKIIPPLYGKELGDELRKNDVYVTAARWEACGSHHVEGAACGLPVIYHNDGGGVVEMCQRYGWGIDRVEQISGALMNVSQNYNAYRENAEITDLSASTMCKKYLDVIWNMCSLRTP